MRPLPTSTTYASFLTGFANSLWWFHLVVVVLVVLGFFGQFFVPALVPFELGLVVIVVVSQFLWFGKCPCTELERYLRLKANPDYRPPKDGCIVEASLKYCGVRLEDDWISAAGLLMLAATAVLYVLYKIGS